VCVEKDRCIDMPEFFLWTLKLAETIEQVSNVSCCQLFFVPCFVEKGIRSESFNMCVVLAGRSR